MGTHVGSLSQNNLVLRSRGSVDCRSAAARLYVVSHDIIFFFRYLWPCWPPSVYQLLAAARALSQINSLFVFHGTVTTSVSFPHGNIVALFYRFFALRPIPASC